MENLKQGKVSMKTIRYIFWLGVHDALEKSWHWVYRNKVQPNQPSLSKLSPPIYTKIFENDEVTIYRSN